MQFCKKIAIFLAIFSSFAAHAQNYPDKPIRIVTSFSAGSGPDALMRNVGDKLGKQVGQAIIMDNRPGANGWLAVDAVKKSAADGYTFLQVDNTHVSLQQHLFKKIPFDFNKDFEPATPLYWTNFFIVVPINSKWHTVTDLINAAKEKSGALTYASWGVGSAGHVGAAMFEAETNTQMNHVPYKDLPSVYNAVANGEVDWAFGTAASAGPLYRAKKVKFIAIAAPKRLAGYLDIPTVTEAGGPKNFELKTWVAIYALKGTPKSAIDKFNQETLAALKDPDVQKSMSTFGFEPWLTSPAEVAKDAEIQSKKFEVVVKQAKMSID